MFSSLGLFKEIPCPDQAHCLLPNCLFAHQTPTHRVSTQEPLSENHAELHEDSRELDVPRKRRRITPATPETVKGSNDAKRIISHSLPETAVREISPPPARKRSAGLPSNTSTVTAAKSPPTHDAKLLGEKRPTPAAEQESLNPRMLRKPPASHAHRRQLILMLHEHMSRLNEELKTSQHEKKEALTLSSQELIKSALSEEETIAKDNPAVYFNIIKLRIQKLKKMKLLEWIQERLKWLQSQLPLQSSTPVVKPTVTIDTGLTTDEEIAFLPFLFANQKYLGRYGYVVKAPAPAEIESARQGVEAAKGWEECERCKTRFQVFPGRRAEDGALTSGGNCVHHPAKARRPPPADRADKIYKEPIYGCCNEIVGTSTGCAAAPSHVFKVSEAKRLALIMPFEATPSKGDEVSTTPKTAVCFDCEMCYTTQGLELVRLTATSWPQGKALVDVLVRPQGEIIDLNSRYSGVWPNDFANAIPYDPDKEGTDDNDAMAAKPPRIVPSPSHARSLLFHHLDPGTPLIGHAIDNDLNATRVIHPSIIDTVLLYPHHKGLPIRFGLKVLVKKHLDRDIQMGGPTQGHDSAEDAQAAGDLVRLRVAQRWASMKRDGWTLQNGDFVPAPAEGPLARSVGVASSPVSVANT